MPEQQAYSEEQTVIELTNRLRVLESKQSMFSERLLVVNQNMLEEYKRLMKEIKAVDIEINELKKDLNNLKNILKHLTEEASTFAKKDSLKVLEKYINLWNPLNFVTEKDVENIIKRTLEDEDTKKAMTHIMRQIPEFQGLKRKLLLPILNDYK